MILPLFLLSLLGGCDPTRPPPPLVTLDDTGAAPLALTSWLEAATCEALPEDAVWLAPESWGPAPLLPAYDAYLDWLATSPNRADKAGTPQRILDDLAVLNGDLYAGLGDWGYNTGSLYCHDRGGACPYEDADGHGIPLLRWAPGGDGTPVVAALLEEEELQRLRPAGEVLLIPSLDPSRGDPAPGCAAPDAEPACPEEAAHDHPRFATGNTSLVDSNDSSAIFSEANIPDALHVFDMAAHGGRLVAIGASATPGEDAENGSHAAIWASSDQGRTWALVWRDGSAVGKRRLTALVPVGERLLAVGYHTAEAGEQTLWLEIAPDNTVTDDIAAALAGYPYPAQAMPLSAATTLLWTRTTAARLSWAGDTLRVVPLALEGAPRVVDAWLLCAGDLLLLTLDVGRQEYQVYRTADLETFTRLVVWPATVSLAALAYWDGHLVFGATGDRLLRTP